MTGLTLPAIIRHPIKNMANSFAFLYLTIQLALIIIGLLMYVRDFKTSRESKQ